MADRRSPRRTSLPTDDPSSMSEALLHRLRRLDFVEGPIDIERIPGGITNHNFAVRAGGRAYVARLCEDRPLLGIDRRNEVVCQQAAERPGARARGHPSRARPAGHPLRRRADPDRGRRPPARAHRPPGGVAATPAPVLGHDDRRGPVFLPVPDRPHLRPDRGSARGRPARRDRRPARGRATAVSSDRAVPPGPVPQRPAAGQPDRRWTMPLAGRLGIRRHRPSPLRPGQPLGQRRPRRRSGARPADRLPRVDRAPRPRRAADLPGRVAAPRGPLGDDPVGRLRHRHSTIAATPTSTSRLIEKREPGSQTSP